MADPFDYASFKELASELIEAAGESATLKRGAFVGRGRERKKVFARTQIGMTEIVRGAWGAPETMTEQTIASGDRDDFTPTGDSGVRATNLGMFAWYTEGDTLTLLFQPNDDYNGYKKTKINAGGWSGWVTISVNPFIPINANRARQPIPTPDFIVIIQNGATNVSHNLPNITIIDIRQGILIDDATGQSLYYCNDQISACQHYRRTITDAQPIYAGHDPVAIKVVESEHNIEQRISSNEGVSVDEDLRGFIVSAAAGVVPEIDDIIVLASDPEHEIGITDVQPLKPGGTTILYEVMGQV